MSASEQIDLDFCVADVPFEEARQSLRRYLSLSDGRPAFRSVRLLAKGEEPSRYCDAYFLWDYQASNDRWFWSTHAVGDVYGSRVGKKLAHIDVDDATSAAPYAAIYAALLPGTEGYAAATEGRPKPSVERQSPAVDDSPPAPREMELAEGPTRTRLARGRRIRVTDAQAAAELLP